MRTTSRFLAAAAALALAALPLAGCVDAGDNGGTPTGPAAQYTPGMDLTGSTLSATQSGTAAPGELFDILAQFLGGQGLPVEGTPLLAYDEEDGCFTFPTDPTLTNSEGRASIPVKVSPTCLPGSYTITVATFPAQPMNAARVETFVHVYVVDGDAILTLTLQPGSWEYEGPVPTPALLFTAFVTTTDNCNAEFQFNNPQTAVQWEPTPPKQNGTYSITFSQYGVYMIQARARCKGSTTWVYSNTSTVTVNQGAP